MVHIPDYEGKEENRQCKTGCLRRNGENFGADGVTLEAQEYDKFKFSCIIIKNFSAGLEKT